MKKGFTLIELLVVISIIGVLVAVAVASYTGAQIKARDARRRADMKAVQSTMEQYYSTTGNNSYATTLATAFSPLPVPADPKNTGTYQYTDYDYLSSSAYCVCALLEEIDKGNSKIPGSTTCSWNTAGTGDYFCIQNQQ
jgi:prepilin-type N-terminal cleavage/methylation domain-containing protein